jgi:hypothetical protein
MEGVMCNAENCVNRILLRKYGAIHIKKYEIDISFTPSERTLLLELSQTLKSVLSKYPKYTGVTDKDICIVMILTYYSLNLGEQTTDMLTVRTFEEYSDDQIMVKDLWLVITTGELMDGDRNVSSVIRRSMFGMEIMHEKTS